MIGRAFELGRTFSVSLLLHLFGREAEHKSFDVALV